MNLEMYKLPSFNSDIVLLFDTKFLCNFLKQKSKFEGENFDFLSETYHSVSGKTVLKNYYFSKTYN